MTPTEFALVRKLAQHALQAAAALPPGHEAGRAIRHYVFRLQIELSLDAGANANRAARLFCLAEQYDQQAVQRVSLERENPK